MPAGGDPRNVVRFWRLVELFSPQRVRGLDANNPTRPVVRLTRSGRVPWRDLPAPARPNLTWAHTVFLGVYEIGSVYEYLHRVFPEDRDAYDERPGGLSACAALTVDDDGHVVAGSAVLSSAAWGVGQIAAGRTARAGWPDDFEDAQDRFRQRVDDCLADARHAQGEGDDAVMDHDLVDSLVTGAWWAADLTDDLTVATRTVHVASVQVRKDRADDAASDFLNSFYLDDLAAIADSPWGPALSTYLTPGDRVRFDERIDVRQDPDAVHAAVGIDRLPSGRWPSNPEHPLATSQQLAVNEAAHTLGRHAGLLGVNGPPGTGKTTLLRDVFAHNVVERAAVLASLRTPDDAFIHEVHRWRTGAYPRSVRQLRDDVVGYEMVVASSNNAAVENVTDELPRSTEIDARWRGTVDYFADLATALTPAGDTEGSGHPPAWGLVAARLGNAANRSRFLGTFWFGRGDQKQPHAPSSGVVHGLQRLLQGWERDPHTRPDWTATTAAFRAAAEHVERLRQERADAAARLARTRTVAQEREEVRRAVADADLELVRLGEQMRAATVAATAAADVTSREATRRDRHLQVRPGLWETLTSLGAAARTWRAELVRLNAALTSAEDEQADAAAAVAHAERACARATDTRSAHAEHLVRLGVEAAALSEQVRRDGARFGSTHPGPEWLADDVGRELRAPWQDPELNEARSELLVHALAVHQAFLAGVTGAAAMMRACVEVVGGSSPRDLESEKRRAAWQFFFLAVPLVSTTFASAARMLHGLDAESLGWLLIDEAGQASPQEAVGAIWRSRRVLAVGDPMQLQPVVSVPRRAQQAIARRFDVDDDWVPSVASVQSLADRVSRYGTTLPTGTATAWVSSPLRVHRRCDSPMFELSNAIAYDNFMIRGVERPPEDFAHVPVTRWIDVPGRPGSHLQRAEVEALRDRLEALVAAGLEPDEIIVISPFRAVADELDRLSSRWPGLKAGTVHTAQGRQAPVVFLLLGGDPARPGALRWAAETPNLLNVAASRAQRRLYVVGDRRRWADLPYFRTAADLLAADGPPVPSRALRR